MSKLARPELPDIRDNSLNTVNRIILRLYELLREHVQQINGLADGSITAYTARTSAPTTGAYKRGDFVPNSEPSELGSVGAKYIIRGWVCTVSGNPATFVQSRALTGG